MSVVEIDDSDPSIAWTGNWTRAGVPSEHDNTVSGGSAGSTALVTFTGMFGLMDLGFELALVSQVMRTN